MESLHPFILTAPILQTLVVAAGMALGVMMVVVVEENIEVVGAVVVVQKQSWRCRSDSGRRSNRGGSNNHDDVCTGVDGATSSGDAVSDERRRTAAKTQQVSLIKDG